MALAAALAADGGRPVSILPTIKCSSCGREIEIAEMGEHVCGGEDTKATPNGHMSTMSNPFTLRRLNASGQQPSNHPPVPQVNDSFRSPPKVSQIPGARPPKSALPKINPDAANRPFLAPRQPGLDSPISPAASYRSGSSTGKPPFARSMTSPAPRLYDPRPPSPGLSANLDCAFPPFPTAASSSPRPSTSHGRRTPTGSERAPSRAASRLDHVVTAEPEPFNVEPRLPKSNGSESVLQKLNTIKSGPFSANKRQGSGDSKDGSAFSEQRRPSEPTVESLPTRPSTASSNYSLPRRPSIPSFNIPQPSQKKTPPPRPARPTEEVLSPRFLDQLSAEPSSSMALEPQSDDQQHNRSNTYPVQNQTSESEHAQSLSRMRSEPALSGSNRRPSLAHGAASDPSTIPQTQVFAPRSDSRTGNRVDYRIQDAPPVPRAVQQYRQDSAHTPSESGSSITSSNNSRSTTNSSGVSPVGSVASSVDAFSPLTFESKKYGEDEQMRVAGLNVKSPEKPGMRAEQPTQRSPPRTVSRPARETPKKADEVSLTPLESPMDPMLLNMQHKAPQPPASQSRPAPLRTQTAPGPVPRSQTPQAPAVTIPQRSIAEESPVRSGSEPEIRPRTPGNASPQSTAPSTRNVSPSSVRPPAIPQDQQRRHHGRRPTNAKPMCRGCGQMIEGKSVKASDGRLTGRWHKACFVCRSCHEPFTTADFYVINNEPYCEQHYHEHNGSLCNGCHRGIEGQYLETSSSTRFGSIEKKFHPRCFCCCECRVVLSSDYFEITGKVYCERHALAAMRAQARMAGGLQAPNQRGLMAERRTTRLINPMMA
ncbi:hypothetical protein M409DRAFT_16955 [Zasmidium cellare ATCC 36951]|uniref:LIM zinc-binding domain-containing protein n=1 Tax=Zasmidium cellare ATCC 36951 TaxID=1080233 RepID=A0A6A6D5R7_ZASCE|nr:uncharacterized protein M409DRAFT_16955 [Zasmidium cellare ATCC 36951]KAF2173006.1 hypothetical protein M409DRAFT_16955 [Zasmidium cellare ATCC 36951]